MTSANKSKCYKNSSRVCPKLKSIFNMTAPAPARFCSACGHPRNPDAKFCGHCGAAFTSSTPPPLPAAGPSSPASNWQVAVGGKLPTVQPNKKRKPNKSAPSGSAASPPTAKAKSLWGSTLFMAVTQGADLMTRAMESNTANDRTLYLRLGIAAAVAVFGISLGSTPRLRMILVRVGATAIGLLQGASLWGQIQALALDPQVLQAAMPNLGAQFASVLAIFRLFQQAGKR